MFEGVSEPEKSEKIDKIVDRLTNLSQNKQHDRHIHYQECKEMGLNIELLEDVGSEEFQDLVLTVHHCFIYSLQSTYAYKFIEDHRGQATVKQTAH